MKNRIIYSLLAAVLLSVSAHGKAKPAVGITTASYEFDVVRDSKGKILKDKKGKAVKKWQKATKVVPGDIVKYVDTVTNSADTPVKNVKVVNPINKNLAYVANSAKSSLKSSIKYSVDGGKSFDVPNNLYVVGKDKKKHKAKASQYNAIEFVLSEVPAKSKTDVEFKVKLK